MVVASMATAKVRRCESLAGSPACLADRYNDPCGRHATIVRTPSRYLPLDIVIIHTVYYPYAPGGGMGETRP